MQNALTLRFKMTLRSTKLSRRRSLLNTSQNSGPAISMTPLSWLNAYLFFQAHVSVSSCQRRIGNVHLACCIFVKHGSRQLRLFCCRTIVEGCPRHLFFFQEHVNLFEQTVQEIVDDTHVFICVEIVPVCFLSLLRELLKWSLTNLHNPWCPDTKT